MLSTTTIVGRLTEAPQLRETPKGQRVATLRVAVNDHRLGKEPRFVDIDQWDDVATNAAAHLVRGQQIAADGLLNAHAYKTDDGNLHIGWTLTRARVEWGPKPLRETPIDRLIDEAGRRRQALQPTTTTEPQRPGLAA